MSLYWVMLQYSRKFTTQQTQQQATLHSNNLEYYNRASKKPSSRVLRGRGMPASN